MSDQNLILVQDWNYDVNQPNLFFDVQIDRS